MTVPSEHQRAHDALELAQRRRRIRYYEETFDDRGYLVMFRADTVCVHFSDEQALDFVAALQIV
jgi:lactam utilization protein B